MLLGVLLILAQLGDFDAAQFGQSMERFAQVVAGQVRTAEDRVVERFGAIQPEQVGDFGVEESILERRW